MKELTIEEKAKDYNNLIKRLKDFQSEYRFKTIDEYFPELKESEESKDEKIRKEIVSAINIYCSEYHRGTKVRNDMLAWLEKQAKGKKEEYVDLGLPSGLKWAKGNLKKSGNTYVISNETDYGDFWSWGNVGGSSYTGYMPSQGGKMMTDVMYDTTTGKQLTDNIPVDAAYDVARNRLGYPWRLPTQSEFKELIDNTDHEWTSINGVYGCKFIKKSDHSAYVFFPASGGCYESGLIRRGSYGHYWSSTIYSAKNAFYMYFNSACAGTNYYGRNFGFSIRPVMK